MNIQSVGRNLKKKREKSLFVFRVSTEKVLDYFLIKVEIFVFDCKL